MEGKMEDILTDIYNLLEERLPKPGGVDAVADEPTHITEDQPVGTRIADLHGDVWKRFEDGWGVCVDGAWGKPARTFRYVHGCYAPLRPATPADLARVGIEPVEAEPERRVNVTITDVYAAPDGYGFLRINVGPETAVIDPRASNVTVTDVVPAPADDYLRERLRADVAAAAAQPDHEKRYMPAIEQSMQAATPAPADDLPVDPDEALARAIYAAEGEDDDGEWDDLHESVQDDFRRMARAAREHIEAEKGSPGPVNALIEQIERTEAEVQRLEASVAAEWADHFEIRQGMVGTEPLTVESMIAALRGPRPFGCEAGESGADA